MNGPKPHYYGHRERLRKRFLIGGFEDLADYEIVEMLLTIAIPRRDVKEQAKALIKRFGNLRGILDAPIDEVRKVDGIGEVTPVVLRMLREIVSLYLQQAIEKQEALSDPNRLHEFWRVKIGNNANEVFMVGYPNPEVRVLAATVRPVTSRDRHATEATMEVTTEATTEVRLLIAVKGEMTRQALQTELALKNAEHFRKTYLLPALRAGIIEMTVPDKPRSPNARVEAALG